MDQIFANVSGGGMFVSFSSMKLRCCRRTDTGRHVTRDNKIGGQFSLLLCKLYRRDRQIYSQSIELDLQPYVSLRDLNE